ncbi:hypothetical protein ACLOJK_021148 [Asimina triloba]
MVSICEYSKHVVEDDEDSGDESTEDVDGLSIDGDLALWARRTLGINHGVSFARYKTSELRRKVIDGPKVVAGLEAVAKAEIGHELANEGTIVKDNFKQDFASVAEDDAKEGISGAKEVDNEDSSGLSKEFQPCNVPILSNLMWRIWVFAFIDQMGSCPLRLDRLRSGGINPSDS